MGTGIISSVGSFILSLFGIRTITQDFIPVPDQPYLEVDPDYFTVTPDPANQRNVLTGAGPSANPVLGNVTVTSITYAPGVEVDGPAVGPVTYSDANSHTLATISSPAGSVTLIQVSIVANLMMPATSVAGTGSGTWVVWALCNNLGSGGNSAVTFIAQNSLNANSPPFLPAATTSTSGLVAIVANGNDFLIEVNGFAPLGAWASGTAYVTGNGTSVGGDFVTANGNVYLCTTSGTSSGSAPSGTGTALGSGAKFDYVCTGSTIPVRWTMGAPRQITG